jgi:hypothetical protein
MIPACAGMTVGLRHLDVIPAQAGIHAEPPDKAHTRAGKNHAKKNLNWNIIVKMF